MKVNSHCWLRTAWQQVVYFYHLMEYSNKHRTEAAALIRVNMVFKDVWTKIFYLIDFFQSSTANR